MTEHDSTAVATRDEPGAAPADAGRPSERPGRRAASAALLAVPVAIALVTGFARRWVTDDGFIYLRIVQQVGAGNGPVFNAGERVEAYTSPAWVAIVSVADLALPIRLEWIAILLGLAFAAVGLVAAMLGAVRLAGTDGDGDPARHPLLVPAGAFLIVAPFATWVWITSGLETSLTWAWLGASLFVLARWATDDEASLGLGACVLVGLGWLVRPELVLFSGLFLLVVLAGEWRSSTWQRRAGTVAAMVALPVAYQLFRMGYFGSLVANTAIAKEGTDLHWARGYDYLRDLIDPYWLWFPIAVVLVGGYVPLARRAGRRQRLVLAAFLVGSVALFGYVVAVGGDYLHARLFVPALFALAAPVAAVPAQRRFWGLALLVPWAVVALLALRPPQLGDRTVEAATALPDAAGEVTLEDVGWQREKLTWLDGSDLYFQENPFQVRGVVPVDVTVADGQPTPTVVASGIGRIAFALGPDVHIVDALGLANPIGSHFTTVPELQRPAGHEKPSPTAWLVAEVTDPDADVAPDAMGLFIPLVPTPDGAAFDQQVADARAVLRCGDVRRLRQAATAPLGPRRIVSNLLHAPANTRLRIPPDPAQARAELC